MFRPPSFLLRFALAKLPEPVRDKLLHLRSVLKPRENCGVIGKDQKKELNGRELQWLALLPRKRAVYVAFWAKEPLVRGVLQHGLQEDIMEDVEKNTGAGAAFSEPALQRIPAAVPHGTAHHVVGGPVEARKHSD